MKLRKSVAMLSLALATMGGQQAAFGDDIDVFVGGKGVSSKPNLLIVLDNSSNWSASLAADPNAEDGDKTTKRTKFYHEMKSLGAILDALGKCSDGSVTVGCATVGEALRVGLMLFTETGTNGGYVRYTIRDMTADNRNALKCMLTGKPTTGYTTCPAGAPGFKESGADTDNSASNQPYAKVLFEAFKYFGGYSSPAYAYKDTQPPSAINDQTHFGPTAYAGWGTDSGSDKGTIRRDYRGNNNTRSANNAYVTYPAGDFGAFVNPSAGALKDSNIYSDPITDSCAKNFVIFISNGNPGTGGDSGGTPEKTLLTNVGGNTTEIKNAAGSVVHASFGDEFSRFLYQTDVSKQLGQQNVVTYTMAVYDPADANQTATKEQINLMSSMATAGGGNYYEATNGATMVSGLLAAINQILARDSTFVTASLPVNTNSQGEFLNQVFIGMFRPDNNGNPRWWGNVKQYRLACMIGAVEDTSCGKTSSVQLVDSSTPPKIIYSAGTAFIDSNITSYWTQSSTFWANDPRGTSSTPTSDDPDGETVEKGGAAQRLRIRFATDQSGRNVLTCPATGTAAAGDVKGACGTIGAFNYTGASALLGSYSDKFFQASTPIPGEIDLGSKTKYSDLAAADKTTEFQRLIDWVRGKDNINPSDERGPGDGVTVRPSIHGDVVHGRPVALDFGTGGVVLFYGDNHGHLHAVKGAADHTSPTDGGKELWSFIAPEFFPKLARLRSNQPALLTPKTPAGIVPAPQRKDYFWDGSITAYQNKTVSPNKAHLFITARRGGRFMYALDVSDPTTPKYLWKIDESKTGFDNIGQTWSSPVVTRIRLKEGTEIVNKLVLIFGGGYPGDYKDGITPICEDAGGIDGGTRDHLTSPCNRGRGIYIVDAANGDLIKHIGASFGDGIKARAVSDGPTPTITTTSIDMDYAIPSDVYPMDSDFDGITDRVYVGDLGGRLWRVELSDTDGDKGNWKAYLLGDFEDNEKKIFFRPAVVQQGDYTAVLAGSGDREKPLNTANQDGFIMIRDKSIGLLSSSSPWTPILASGLCEQKLSDPSTNTWSCDAADIKAANGWRFVFQASEKVVNSPRVAFSVVNFATNVPQANTPGQCFNTGQARSYQVNFESGVSAISSGSPYTLMETGGLAPTAFVGIVDINGNKIPVVIGGGVGDKDAPCVPSATKSCFKVPSVPSTRQKRYWYKKKD